MSESQKKKKASEPQSDSCHHEADSEPRDECDCGCGCGCNCSCGCNCGCGCGCGCNCGCGCCGGNNRVLASRPAPAFTTTAVMPDLSFAEVSLSDYAQKRYVLLFFYPLDFTFVCPTEIIAFSQAAPQFEELGVQILSCSIDSPYTHLAWRMTSRQDGGLGEIRYPMLSDLTHQIARSYGVLTPDGHALRGLFLIDRDGVVQHQVVNNLSLGRSVEESLRMVKALQFVEQHGEVCPANWHEGDSGMKADPEGAKEFFRHQK